MRLFTGISLPPEASAIVAARVGELRSLTADAGLKLSWVSEPKLHITTKFIGEFPEDRLPELEQALAAIRTPELVAIHIHQIDWLRPGALIAKVDAGQELLALASATDAALRSLGIDLEKRAYRPHVTLARIRNPHRAPLRAFPSALDLRFHANSFHLYLSADGQYTKLKEFPLQTE